MAGPSDEALMRALQRGDLAAFEALFRRHYDRVRDLCARITASSVAGDDLAQETFLRILKHRATFRGDARFTTWVYRIARNLCLEAIARENRDRQIAERWEADATTPATIDRSDELEALASALNSLPAEQREVIVLCRYHDLPFAEVAEVLGCTPGAARVRAHRALIALREALRNKGSGV